MSNEPKAFVPFVHVKDVAASVEFYKLLGFSVLNTFVPPGHASPVWAWMKSGAANVMLAAADGPFDSDQQAVLFYLYVDDLEGKRADLVEKGIDCGAIEQRFYAPRGEFRIQDPDAYVIMVMHT